MRRSPSGTIELRTVSEAVVLTYRVRASLGSYRRIDDRQYAVGFASQHSDTTR